MRKYFWLLLVFWATTGAVQAQEIGRHESPHNDCIEPTTEHFHWRVIGGRRVATEIKNPEDLRKFIAENPANWRRIVIDEWKWEPVLLGKVLEAVQAGRIVSISWDEIRQRLRDDLSLENYIIQTKIPTCIILRNMMMGPSAENPGSPPESAGTALYDPTDMKPASAYMFKASDFTWAVFVCFCSNPAEVDLPSIPVTDMRIKKSGRNVTANDTTFKEETPANPGNRVQFVVEIDSAGNQRIHHSVITRDVLPTRTTFVSGSMTLDDVPVTQSQEKEFFRTGINLGDFPPDTKKAVKFDVVVVRAEEFRAEASATEIVRVTLTNRAFVKSDEMREKEADARIIVVIQPQVPQLTLAKEVQSIKAGRGTEFFESISATAEEDIRYRATLTTRDSTIAQRPKIRDSLNNLVIYKERTLMINGRQASREEEMRFFQDGIELPEMQPNATLTIVYEAEVARTSSFQVDREYRLENEIIVATD